MSDIQYVQDILVAIKSVKARAKEAQERGDNYNYYRLMGDLIGLEVCLVGETEKYIIELQQNKEAA